MGLRTHHFQTRRRVALAEIAVRGGVEVNPAAVVPEALGGDKRRVRRLPGKVAMRWIDQLAREKTVLHSPQAVRTDNPRTGG